MTDLTITSGQAGSLERLGPRSSTIGLQRAEFMLELIRGGKLGPRSQMILLRRASMTNAARRDQILAHRRALHREANKLREHLPFTARRVAELRRAAVEYESEYLAQLEQVLAGTGGMLLKDKTYIAEFGLDWICDFLNINPVHRERAIRESEGTIGGLLILAEAEDSAEWAGKSRSWFDGGPLMAACRIALREFVRTCPEHLLPDPFEFLKSRRKEKSRAGLRLITSDTQGGVQ